MRNLFHQAMTFYSCLTGVYSDSNHATHLSFLCGFLITYNKCTNVLSKGRYIHWEKVAWACFGNSYWLWKQLSVYWLLFALAVTLMAAIIFTLTEVNLVHFKRKKPYPKSFGKLYYFFQLERVQQTDTKWANTLEW